MVYQCITSQSFIRLTRFQVEVFYQDFDKKCINNFMMTMFWMHVKIKDTGENILARSRRSMLVWRSHFVLQWFWLFHWMGSYFIGGSTESSNIFTLFTANCSITKCGDWLNIAVAWLNVYLLSFPQQVQVRYPASIGAVQIVPVLVLMAGKRFFIPGLLLWGFSSLYSYISYNLAVIPFDLV